jgi:hypothetical protein
VCTPRNKTKNNDEVGGRCNMTREKKNTLPGKLPTHPTGKKNESNKRTW